MLILVAELKTTSARFLIGRKELYGGRTGGERLIRKAFPSMVPTAFLFVFMSIVPCGSPTRMEKQHVSYEKSAILMGLLSLPRFLP
jgi:hypothetical protein